MSGIRTRSKKDILLFVLMLSQSMAFATSVDLQIPTFDAQDPEFLRGKDNASKDDDSELSDAEIAGLVAGGVAGLAALGAAVYGAKKLYDKSSPGSLADSSDPVKQAKTADDFARIQSRADDSTKRLQAEKNSILAGRDFGRTAAETQQRLAAIDVQMKKNEETKKQAQSALQATKPIQTNTPGNATPELDDKLRRVNNALSIYGVSSHQNLMDNKGNITLPKDMPDADKVRPLLEQRHQITQERNAILSGEKPVTTQSSEAEKPTQTAEPDKPSSTSEPDTQPKPITASDKPIQTNTPGNATPELDDKLRRVNNALSIYGVSSHQNLMDDKGNITLPKNMPDADKVRPLLEQRHQITQERNAILSGEKPVTIQTSEAEKPVQAAESDKPSSTSEPDTQPKPITAETKQVDTAPKKTFLQKFSQWRQSQGGGQKATAAPTISEPVKKAGGVRNDALKTYLAGAKTPEDFKEIQSRLQDGEKDLSRSISDLTEKRAALVDEQQAKGDSPELKSRLAEVDQALKDNNSRLAEVRTQISDVKKVVVAHENAASASKEASQAKDAFAIQKKMTAYKPLQTASPVPGSDTKQTSAAENRQQLKDTTAASKQRASEAKKRALQTQHDALEAQKKLKSQYHATPEKTTRPVRQRPNFMR